MRRIPHQWGRFDAIRQWVRRRFATELPCGCLAMDGRGAEYSSDTTVMNRDLETTHSIDYENCRKTEQDWIITIRCDHCGAEWIKRRSAARSFDFGEENPGTGVKIELKHRPGFLGGAWSHTEVPVVSEPDRSGGDQ